MSIYDNDPEKAIAILDSAIAMGNVGPIDADMMRARIFASSCKNRNLDSAQRLCEQLMELEEVKKDKTELFNVLEQLVDISWKRQDDEQLLYWARQFAELCHERGDTVEALRTKAEIGLALYRLGNRDEGMGMLDHAIGLLDKGRLFNQLDAYIIATKRKITALNDDRSFGEVIPLARSIIAHLEDYEQHPNDYIELRAATEIVAALTFFILRA